MIMNVMMDLETWGTAPGAALRSIGAVFFDPYGTTTGEEFYLNISEDSCLRLGLHKDPDTVLWWQNQSKEARQSLLHDPVPVEEVVIAFHEWFRKNKGMWIWSQGASFDVVLWEEVGRRLRNPAPWKFWDVRDTRTAYEMGRFDPRSIKRRGTYHNALDDAKHQAACVQAAYRRIQQVRSN